MFTRTSGKKILMMVVLTAASYLVLAASGGGNKKTKTNNAAAASKKHVYKPLSLRSGFEFKGNKLLSNTQKQQQVIQLSSYATVKRGNNTYIIPFKHNIGVQPGQVTTIKSQKYIEVRLVNISLKP
jgi:predicted lipase